MADLLNLDALKATKSFTLNGTQRPLRSMTVGQFINSDEFDKQYAGASAAEQMKMLVDLIEGFVAPETTREELHQLEISQLTALLNYARGTDVSENPTANGGTTASS